jgi:hypothetical protein
MNYLEMNTWFVLPILIWYFARFSHEPSLLRQNPVANSDFDDRRFRQPDYFGRNSFLR